VLSKSELIASLQNEVHILLHLASKIDRAQLEYRPTPKQPEHHRAPPLPEPDGADAGPGGQERDDR
jgi:hypothetical protein